MAWCFYHDRYRVEFPEEVIARVRVFDIVLSAFTGVVFIILITIENNRQEKMIRAMLREKDVLVAEVFHRVKNNMNIVTSLLSLRSHISSSEEVKEALEDCRNRVFSMALVHEKIFHSNEVSRLDFGEYAHDLADEISMSLGLSGEDMISVRSDEMELPLKYAIPCGLILNELVTNSCKHGRIGDRPLHISIGIHAEGEKRVIEVQDNGPGASEQQMQREGSLGLDLIRSLCQQIEAEYRFSSRNGLHFQMRF
jgi:two-component sensor histidine kinase